jgi:hypothetical protein
VRSRRGGGVGVKTTELCPDRCPSRRGADTVPVWHPSPTSANRRGVWCPAVAGVPTRLADQTGEVPWRSC